MYANRTNCCEFLPRNLSNLKKNLLQWLKYCKNKLTIYKSSLLEK